MILASAMLYQLSYRKATLTNNFDQLAFSQESEITSAQGKISSVTGLRLLYM